jgi:glycosyltransferase involved in cell wall biosynthesis
MKRVIPYQCDIDILYNENNKGLIKQLIDDCDIFHLNSWYFIGQKEFRTLGIFKVIPLSKIHLIENNYKLLNQIFQSKLPQLENLRWKWYMSYINKLKIQNKKVLLHYHGGDLRRVMSKDNKKFINKHKLQSVVSIPDLLPQLDNTEWLPIPVPTESDLFTPSQNRNDDIIKVVHTPTQRDAKKTDVIIKAVDLLKKKYDVELMLIENIPYEECLKLKKEAHISFDNIEYGSYAGCSIEALCHEQPTLVYLNNTSMEEIEKESQKIGIKSPFINVGGPNQPNIEFLNKVVIGKAKNIITKVDYQSVYNNLERLLADDSLRREIGKRGRKWVCKVHDEKIVSEKLVKKYESLERYQ